MDVDVLVGEFRSVEKERRLFRFLKRLEEEKAGEIREGRKNISFYLPFDIEDSSIHRILIRHLICGLFLID